MLLYWWWLFATKMDKTSFCNTSDVGTKLLHYECFATKNFEIWSISNFDFFEVCETLTSNYGLQFFKVKNLCLVNTYTFEGFQINFKNFIQVLINKVKFHIWTMLLQSNSVITNSRGPTELVRYNREEKIDNILKLWRNCCMVNFHCDLFDKMLVTNNTIEKLVVCNRSMNHIFY